MDKKNKIIFFGSDPWSIPVLQALESHFEVAAVVTAPNSAVANYFNGPVLTPEKLDEYLQFKIYNLKFDLAVVASYGKIIPQEILDIPKFGFLNVHPSLLPKYRGASPVPATILNGDKVSGVTIIKMDSKMDHGPIVSTKEISLSGQEGSLGLLTKLFQLGAVLLVDIIPNFIAGKVALKDQDHQKATFTKLLRKEDGYFDITSPPDSVQLDRMIRAYSPWPGVWTRFRPSGSSGQARIVKFLPSSVIPAKAGIHTNKFLIQMEGKKPLPLKAFQNGYPDFPLKLN